MNKLITFMRESYTARFFIPFGLILIIVGIVIFVINSKNQNYLKVESTVSSVRLAQEAYMDNDGNMVEATYDVDITYIVDGKEYTEELNGLFEHKVGDKITIYYNPENPKEITQSKSLILPIVIILGGIGALAGGIISAVRAVKRYKKMREQEKGWENG